jgi:hypothetical protein
MMPPFFDMMFPRAQFQGWELADWIRYNKLFPHLNASGGPVRRFHSEPLGFLL